jgi:hypothetical protein
MKTIWTLPTPTPLKSQRLKKPRSETPSVLLRNKTLHMMETLPRSSHNFTQRLLRLLKLQSRRALTRASFKQLRLPKLFKHHRLESLTTSAKDLLQFMKPFSHQLIPNRRFRPQNHKLFLPSPRLWPQNHQLFLPSPRLWPQNHKLFLPSPRLWPQNHKLFLPSPRLWPQNHKLFLPSPRLWPQNHKLFLPSPRLWPQNHKLFLPSPRLWSQNNKLPLTSQRLVDLK